MASDTLSGKVDDDILTIARASIRTWCMARAEAYVPELHRAFQRLAEFPEHGRDASSIKPGYRHMESGRHVVFYRATADGVLIVRVLYDRMDLKRHGT